MLLFKLKLLQNIENFNSEVEQRSIMMAFVNILNKVPKEWLDLNYSQGLSIQLFTLVKPVVAFSFAYNVVKNSRSVNIIKIIVCLFFVYAGVGSLLQAVVFANNGGKLNK